MNSIGPKASVIAKAGGHNHPPQPTSKGVSEGDAARWPPSGCVFARQLVVPKNVFNLISYRILSHQPE
jgi:hypothetical protein